MKEEQNSTKDGLKLLSELEKSDNTALSEYISSLSASDKLALSSVLMDVVSAGLSWFTPTNALGTGVGIASTGLLAGANYLDDNKFDLLDAKDLLISAGLDALTFVPFIGTAAKKNKLAKTLVKSMPLITGLVTAAGVSGSAVEAVNLINDSIKNGGVDWNTDTIRTISNALITTLLLAVGSTKAMHNVKDVKKAIKEDIVQPLDDKKQKAKGLAYSAMTSGIKLLLNPRFNDLSRYALEVATLDAHNETRLEARKLLKLLLHNGFSYYRAYRRFKKHPSLENVYKGTTLPDIYEGYVFGYNDPENPRNFVYFRRPKPENVDMSNPVSIGFHPEFFGVGLKVFGVPAPDGTTTYMGKIVGKGIEHIPSVKLRLWVMNFLPDYPDLDKDILVIKAETRGRHKTHSDFVPFLNSEGTLDFDISSKSALGAAWRNPDGTLLAGNIGGHHVILGTMTDKNGARKLAMMRVDVYKYNPRDFFVTHTLHELLTAQLKKLNKSESEIKAIREELIEMAKDSDGIEKAFKRMKLLHIDTSNMEATYLAVKLYDKHCRPFIYYTEPLSITQDLLRSLDLAYEMSKWLNEKFNKKLKTKREDRVMYYFLEAMEGNAPIDRVHQMFEKRRRNKETGKTELYHNENLKNGGSINYLNLF